VLPLAERHRANLIGVDTPTKTFLNYPRITLLGQRVDAFGLSTTEERIDALRKINLPKDLEALEYYLGLIGWMRNKVPHHVQRAEPLQVEKTVLLPYRRLVPYPPHERLPRILHGWATKERIKFITSPDS